MSDLDRLLLDCLDFFRGYDAERTDERGPSPIIGRLEEELAGRGVDHRPRQTLCPACGWDASFQPPEVVACPSCGEALPRRPRLLACPAEGCGVQVWDDDHEAQKGHLEVHHPAIVVGRLRDAGMHREADEAAERLGLSSEDEDGRLDDLAEEVMLRDGLDWDRSRGLIYERARRLRDERRRPGGHS